MSLNRISQHKSTLMLRQEDIFPSPVFQEKRHKTGKIKVGIDNYRDKTMS